MKTTKRLFVLLVSSVFLFSSCLKNDNVKQPDSPSNNGFGVIIPDGFDWSNSFDVKCDFNIKSDKLAKVKLFMAKEGEPFAAFFVGNDVENVSVTVPNYVKKLYVSYLKEDVLSERTEIAVVNNKLVYTVPADAKDFTEAEPAPLARKATRAGRGNEGKENNGGGNNKGFTFIPADSTGGECWGTVLFEDNWPSYGDYDFNDFVLGYKIKLERQNGSESKGKIKNVTIDLIIRAEGGKLPYEMALRINGIRNNDYKGIISSTGDFANGKIKIAQFTYPKEGPDNHQQSPLILHFERDQLEFKKFYNTLNKVGMEDEELYKGSFELELNAIDNLTDESFDFFLIKKDEVDGVVKGNREIHLKGYAPTPSNEMYNQKIRATWGDAKEGKDHYLSDKNWVWGVKVPHRFAHGIENIHIEDSYPRFIKWLESKGESDKDWYDFPNKSKVIEWN